MPEAAGALLAIGAAVVSNFGVQLQKSTHNKNVALPEHQRRNYLCLPHWWAGMAGVVLGSVGDFLALGLADQALVTSVGGGSTLLCNLIVSHFIQKEELKKQDLVGVSMIIIAAVAIASVSPASGTYTLEQMEMLAQNPYFVAYLVVTLCTIGALLASIASTSFYKWRSKITDALLRPLVRRMDEAEKDQESLIKYVIELSDRLAVVETDKDRLNHAQPREESEVAVHIRKKGESVNWSIGPSEPERIGRIQNLLISQPHRRKYAKWHDAFVFAAISGTIGSLSVLLAGMVSHTLVLAFQFWFSNGRNGKNQLNDAAPWVMVIGMILTIVLQTKYLNEALALADVNIVFPVFQTFWIGFGVLGGMVFYQLREKMKVLQWIFYVTGGCIGLAGCALLVMHGKQTWIKKHRDTNDRVASHAGNSPERNDVSVQSTPLLEENYLEE